MDETFPYKRIAVIGTTGTGKTTLAKQLAVKIGGEYIELDAIFHGPNWVDIPRPEFVANVRARIQAERWVCDGYYGNWARQLDAADLIVWLDYPFRIALIRILRRTFKRLLTKEELWNGNRESWSMAFSRESIIVWFFQTYWKRRREMPRILDSSRYPNAHKMRLRHPREARRLPKQLPFGRKDR